jgi:hypothetical protein
MKKKKAGLARCSDGKRVTRARPKIAMPSHVSFARGQEKEEVSRKSDRPKERKENEKPKPLTKALLHFLLPTRVFSLLFNTMARRQGAAGPNLPSLQSNRAASGSRR